MKKKQFSKIIRQRNNFDNVYIEKLDKGIILEITEVSFASIYLTKAKVKQLISALQKAIN